MQPNRLGRVLGVSARVAAEKLKGPSRPVNSTDTAGTHELSSGPARPASQAEQAAEQTRASAAASPRAASGQVRPGWDSATAARARPAASATAALPARANYAEGGRRLARGAGRFGASLWRPFAHATGVLTLEISGVFFALFTLFFVSHAWQIYKLEGWRDRHFAVYVGLGALFAWFAVSSFWRARRKQRGR